MMPSMNLKRYAFDGARAFSMTAAELGEVISSLCDSPGDGAVAMAELACGKAGILASVKGDGELRAARLMVLMLACELDAYKRAAGDRL